MFKFHCPVYKCKEQTVHIVNFKEQNQLPKCYSVTIVPIYINAVFFSVYKHHDVHFTHLPCLQKRTCKHIRFFLRDTSKLGIDNLHYLLLFIRTERTDYISLGTLHINTHACTLLVSTSLKRQSLVFVYVTLVKA